MDEALKNRVIDALRTVYDPEIPVNIWELGLIYDMHMAENNRLHITMTLTAPGCPVADTILKEVQFKVEAAIPEAESVDVELVWEPIWTQERMSEAAKLELGFL